jgi:hypothetical protein
MKGGSGESGESGGSGEKEYAETLATRLRSSAVAATRTSPDQLWGTQLVQGLDSVQELGIHDRLGAAVLKARHIGKKVEVWGAPKAGDYKIIGMGKIKSSVLEKPGWYQVDIDGKINEIYGTRLRDPSKKKNNPNISLQGWIVTPERIVSNINVKTMRRTAAGESKRGVGEIGKAYLTRIFGENGATAGETALAEYNDICENQSEEAAEASAAEGLAKLPALPAA